MCSYVCWDVGVSISKCGPCEVELKPEKMEEKRGRIKRMRRGRRFWRAVRAVSGVSLAGGAPGGRRRGRLPPNWWTRTPGPPPMLNTKPGVLSKMPPPSRGKVSGVFVDILRGEREN